MKKVTNPRKNKSLSYKIPCTAPNAAKHRIIPPAKHEFHFTTNIIAEKNSPISGTRVHYLG